jgi:hypothetical protein
VSCVPGSFLLLSTSGALCKAIGGHLETKEVNMLEPMHFVTETGTSYASVIEEIQSLHLLSFLLTADHDKADECLLSAIGECAEGIRVFMEWARVCGHGGRFSSARSS